MLPVESVERECSAGSEKAKSRKLYIKATVAEREQLVKLSVSCWQHARSKLEGGKCEAHIELIARREMLETST